MTTDALDAMKGVFGTMPIVESTEIRTLIFTYANDAYYAFVIPYLYFALRTNSDVAVEIAVAHLNHFRGRYWRATEQLHAAFPARKFLIRQAVHGRNIVPNTVRFVEEPLLRADYVYIGDIDILILDMDLTDQHIRNMEQTGLPYSNAVRPGVSRLTGLHFSRFDAYYPLPDLSGISRYH